MQERHGPPGSVTHCDDGNLCADDDCDGIKCEHDPEPGPCDADGNGCTADLCQDMQQFWFSFVFFVLSAFAFLCVLCFSLCDLCVTLLTSTREKF